MAAVPGLLVPGNIDLHARPVVRNRDGSISTVRSMSFGEDGREILVPTVAADGSRILGEREAIEQYRRTGQHLGMFTTPEAATSYAQQLHREQEREYAPMADNSTSKSGKNSVTGKPFTPFEQAFLNARKAGDKTFDYRGKTYTTKLKSEHLLMSPPVPKPSAGPDTGNQSPPGPQDAPGGLYAEMTNPPQQQAGGGGARGTWDNPVVGGALGLQGPGDPAAGGPPPGPASAPPGPVQGPPASPPPGPLQGPGDPAGGGPGAGGPNTQFDAELAAFQQRQAGAVQGQLAQPVSQGQAAGGPIGGPGTAAGYVPPDQGGADQGGADQGGGAIDFQGLARYFYQLGMQAASGAGGQLMRNKPDVSSMGGSR